MPFIPVRLFKEYDLQSVEPTQITKTMTSSGTTGQKVSKIFLDQETASNQSRVLWKIISNFIGTKRLPLLIIDTNFSASCNARLIWGGDDTIRNVRKHQISERGVELVFADRYSFCVIDAQAIIKLSDTDLSKLSQAFYNDSYIMDQNACSSPHLVVWLGENKEKAKDRFWSNVPRIVEKKCQLENIQAVDKYTEFCRDAIVLDRICNFRQYKNFVYCVTLNRLS